MPVYEYTAIDSRGKSTKGSIEADGVRAARQKLRTKGIYATDLKESIELTKTKTRDVKRFFQSNRVAPKDLAVATRQLATLVGAGLPIVSALNALSDQTDSIVLKRIVIDIKENVEEGSALAKAMGNFPKSFPRLYINMVASGEASGTLDKVLLNLADYLEAQLDLRRRVSSALLYPILMLFICTAVVLAMFTFVVPKVVDIFKKQGATLPVPTRVMIAISDFLINYWYLLALAILAVIYFVRWYYGQPKGKLNMDRWMLKLPLFGPLYTKVSTARVTQTLGTLLTSGVGLLAGLEISKNIVGNVHISEALDQAREGVREGKSLAAELRKSGMFPSMVSHMVAVGEKSGELENMLVKVGQAYENEVNASLDGLTSLLEPLLMLVVGAVVLTIVISVLLPMADLINVLQG